MAAMTDQPNLIPVETVVNYDEPPVKPPPLLAVGPIAWVRKNLFATPMDAVLTVVAGAILFSVVTGFLTWAISQANWFAITRNLRLFMLGTFPADSAWRVNLAALIVVFAVGFTLRAFGRITRPALIALVVVLLVIVGAPPLIGAISAPAYTFVAAGETAIESGTVTERPIEAIGFIGRAGETVTVTLDPYLAFDDDAVAGLSGFSDRATQALINAAANRLRAIETRAELERRLASDLLTAAQRAEVTDELAALTVSDPITTRYGINTSAVRVQILDGTSADLAVLANAELVPFDITASYEEPPPLPTLTLTLPADGWYILRQTGADPDVTTIVGMTGIYPLLQRDLGGGRITYSRLIDDFETVAVRPQIDGRDVSALFLNDNQYRGSRSFNDYARLMLAPLFEGMARALIPLALVGAAGYLAAEAIHWQRGLGRRTRAAAATRSALLRWLVTPIWIVTLIFLFLLPYGIPNLSAGEVGLLLGRFLWVGLMFFVGAAHQQQWGRPLLALAMLFGIVLHIAGERLTLGIEAGRIAGVVIWVVIGVYAAQQGARVGGGLLRRGLIGGIVGSASLMIAVLILAPLLGGAGANVLPAIDTRRWGGFLLTMMLTVVAILASFPLGVLLALGRRSTLPVVKWACTIYIELVRGVPLITVLFMAQLLVPLVNASLANVDNVIRAMVGLTMFSAAYLAENVRGGLQSVPHGQEEAARALGLSTPQVTLLILLPQALRAVIPALVGQCIALFKDTSLVALVGLTDLTGIARGVVAQTEFIGLQMEVYAFISVIYFVFSYLMAYVSRRIEASGSGAARRI